MPGVTAGIQSKKTMDDGEKASSTALHQHCCCCEASRFNRPFAGCVPNAKLSSRLQLRPHEPFVAVFAQPFQPSQVPHRGQRRQGALLEVAQTSP